MKNNIFFDRQRFEKVANYCRKNGLTPQFSKIRLSQELKDGQGNYRFYLDEKKNNLAEGDVALNRNDLFIPFGIGVFLALGKKGKEGRSVLQTCIARNNYDVPHFKTPNDVEGFYNGKLSIMMDSTAVNESFPMEVFRKVFDLDRDNIHRQMPQFDTDKALVPLAPEYYFQGTVDTELTLSFDGNGVKFDLMESTDGTAAPTPIADNERSARVVVLMTGVLVKNAADRAADINNVLNA